MQLPAPQLKDHDHSALLEAYLKELNLPMFLEHYQTYADELGFFPVAPENINFCYLKLFIYDLYNLTWNAKRRSLSSYPGHMARPG